MAKYLVMPGWVRSRNDGDWHFVGVAQLLRLYGVNPKECLILQPGQGPGDIGLTEEGFEAMVILRPRYNGNYDLTRLQ